MCYHTVEKYGCGHEDKALIPCEDVFETGKCKKPEEDQIHEKSEPQCKKCKEDGEEEAHLLAQLEKFAMEESLKPSAAPRIRKTNARTMYFKRCIVWNRCKHHSHPRPSDIERDEGNPEYLHVEGWGNCFDCSQAPASVIAKMKQNGDYEKTDPWGAMSRPEIGTGSSKDAAVASLEEIGRGVSHAQAKQYAEEESTASDAASGTEEEYDFGPSKGKGRAGEPMRQHPTAAILEADTSEDEDRAPSARGLAARLRARGKEDMVSDEEEEERRNHKAARRGPVIRHAHEEEDDEEEEGEGEESEEDEQEEEDHDTARPGRKNRSDRVGLGGGAKGHTKVPVLSPRKQPTMGNAQQKNNEHVHEVEYSASEYSDDDETAPSQACNGGEDDGRAIASPEECKAVGIPHGQGFTKERVRMIAARSKQSAQLAMSQFQKGEID
ncbi:MAG: hypothetical protein Q9202_000725 [Teloschistes flavicans]